MIWESNVLGRLTEWSFILLPGYLSHSSFLCFNFTKTTGLSDVLLNKLLKANKRKITSMLNSEPNKTLIYLALKTETYTKLTATTGH